jgi:hypothetical protein
MFVEVVIGAAVYEQLFGLKLVENPFVPVTLHEEAAGTFVVVMLSCTVLPPTMRLGFAMIVADAAPPHDAAA